MSAYNTLDKGVAGLKSGLDSRVKSMVVKEENGIDYGYPVFGYLADASSAYRYHNNRAKVAFDADFVASNSIVITVDGTAVTAVVYATSHAATMTALLAQIEADITGATCTLDSTDVNGRTFFIEIQDDGDRVVSEAITGGGSQATGTITYDTTMIFQGFALFTQKESPVKYDLDGNVIDAAAAKYAYKDSINVMVNGWIYVVTAAAVEANAAAYVVATGANEGKCDDLSTSNVALSGVMFDETVSAAGIALVRVNK